MLTPDQRGKSPDPRCAHNPVGHERDYDHERDANYLPADYSGGVGVDAPDVRHCGWAPVQ